MMPILKQKSYTILYYTVLLHSLHMQVQDTHSQLAVDLSAALHVHLVPETTHACILHLTNGIFVSWALYGQLVTYFVYLLSKRQAA